MNSRRKTYLWFALVPVVAGLALAAAAQSKGGSNATEAFARLKTLAGRWETTTPDGKKAVLTLELVANGSALIEREAVDGDAAHSSMVTLYHLDNDRLLLTHYCMANNQPRMVADSYNPASGTLRFNFLDATNLATPNDGHMRSVVFRFADQDHFAARWTFFKDGKVAFSEEFQYTRLDSGAKK